MPELGGFLLFAEDLVFLVTGFSILLFVLVETLKEGSEDINAVIV